MLMRSALFCGIPKRRAVFTDVLGQRVSPIFKGQEFQEEKDFLTLEDGTDTLSRNVGKHLPLDVAQYRRRAQISNPYLFGMWYYSDFIGRHLFLSAGRFEKWVGKKRRTRTKIKNGTEKGRRKQRTSERQQHSQPFAHPVTRTVSTRATITRARPS
jgi:hypothetical protein